MNINLVKGDILKHLNKPVLISVYGMRNRVSRYEGTIYKAYPNIFSIMINGEEKSFPYRDIITGDLKIIYK